MSNLISFHGDPAIKKKYVDRVKAHAKADEIIKGQYWQNGKGCAIGCTIEGSDHLRYETELGIPVEIAILEDRIFENLENGKAKNFPLLFLESVPVGKDLSLVWPKFAHWLLIDPKDGVIRFADSDKCRDAIQGVADLLKKVIDGAPVSREEWAESAVSAASAAWAERAAWAASAESAAWAARAAWAERAAWAASAASAARAAWAERAAFWVKASKKLLQLLKEAK